jgi:DNA adenine methylase
MPSPYTPLRFPGGKAKLGPFLAEFFKTNRLINGVYAEPYAGGAGAALFLLFHGYATRVLLNDIDPAIVAFWRAVLNHPDRFARRINTVALTVREWDRQRQIYRAGGRGFDLGFAFFYLNRTNRSGIMNAGVIGGREQTGPWSIDARFNRTRLAERVRAIGRVRRKISVTRGDALDFLGELAQRRTTIPRIVCYLDPPYVHKGRDLYTNYYTPKDHEAIAEALKRFKVPWLLTYDDCPAIRRLYCRSHHVYDSEVSYSARDVRRGREILVLGPRLRLPPAVPQPTGHLPGFELR